jgi:hypothetical protein
VRLLAATYISVPGIVSVLAVLLFLLIPQHELGPVKVVQPNVLTILGQEVLLVENKE